MLHLRAQLYTMRESTARLGAAVGRPGLAYVQADPQQGKAALMQIRFSVSAATQLEE